NLSERTQPARNSQNFLNGMHAHRAGAGGGPSDFIGKDTGGGVRSRRHLNRRWRDISEFHSSADGFAVPSHARLSRAGRRILDGINPRHAPLGVYQHPPCRWIAGMLALMLGMDSLWHPPFSPQALFAGGYWAALSSVALAEELVEWLSQKTPKSVLLPPPRCHAGPAHH